MGYTFLRFSLPLLLDAHVALDEAAELERTAHRHR
jgi:hypothetical protein